MARPEDNRIRARLGRRLGGVVVAVGVLIASAVEAKPSVVLVLGDSLSAAYGFELELGWVQLLQQRLAEKHPRFRVVNASITGDTTRGGATRIEAALEAHRPDIVIVELGGNDGLRGLPLDETRKNLDAIITSVASAGAEVLLAGMRLPPNYGPQYAERFHRMYQELAERSDIALIPFLLEGIGARPEFMQEDGIHPRVEAQARILDNVWPHLEPLLAAAKGPT